MTRALLVLACSCGVDATTVHLDVADAPITIDSYELSIGDRDGKSPAVSAFDVWIPDDMAGSPQPVKLWGDQDGQHAAYGETMITPVLHDTVAASITLAPCPNGDCTMMGGTCAHDGDACDDGDACTISDTCEGGACSGTPKCTTAPANADPTCAAGTCDFECHTGFHRSGAGCAANTTDGKIVFVSSAHYTGNLGGLTGADAKCASLATAAGVAGTFKAWLSDSAVDAETRVTHSTGKYVLIDGTVIANSYTMLTSGTLAHAIDRDETGAIVTSDVWTDTNGDGLATEVDPLFTCVDWTDATIIGEVGRSDAKTESWTADGDGDCSIPASIYCIQQ